MNRRLGASRAARIPLTALASLAAVGALAGPAQAAREATDIVQLRPGVSLAQGQAIVRAAHGQVTGRLPLISGLATRLSPAARARLTHDTRIAAVSANAGTRSTWRYRPPTNYVDDSRIASSYPFSVFAPQSWSTATGAGVGVAVIDTGIDGGLPDFTDGNGDSRVVATVVTNPDAQSPNDNYGHGTHVAGIIAGDGSRRDGDDSAAGHFVGVAPRANLVAIKAADDEGRGTILDAIYGLQFVVDHQADYNIRVVNLSLASTESESYTTDPLDAAVEAAYFHGVLVVAAAGNRGVSEGATAFSPGNDPFALTVGAVDDQGTQDRGDDTVAEWSSTGYTQDNVYKPEIVAPGAHIVSTLARGSAFASLCPDCIVENNYIRLGGTSMAAPVVAGVAALVYEIHPDWTPDQVKSTLIDTGRDVPGDVDEVNAQAALSVERPSRGANDDITPNTLVDAATGDIDETRSSWGRSVMGSLELGRQRLGPLELGLHLPAGAERQHRIDPLELGQRHLALPLGLLGTPLLDGPAGNARFAPPAGFNAYRLVSPDGALGVVLCGAGCPPPFRRAWGRGAWAGSGWPRRSCAPVRWTVYPETQRPPCWRAPT